ncbi:hypothetical protein FMM01_02710 [Schleiferilactobacillus harbinensis]|uniref:hypothetical protein n=1 Tax=Schleiferilactobacillus harbinensis TaxID=304207 RepID=UPI00123C4F23|nr:hypothetical protein [Schleiferilactobacillus harbinensis]QEU46277.1 hypothetical protein FMM01_02710 [Schleiferilactobacillus harbinensis]
MSETTTEKWLHLAGCAGVLLAAPWLLAWQNNHFARWGALTLVSLAAIANILYQEWLLPRHPKTNLIILWLGLNLVLGVLAGLTSNWFMPVLVVLAAVLWLAPPVLARRPLEQQLLPVIAYGLAPFLLSIVLYTVAEGGLYLPALFWPLILLLSLAANETMAGISSGPIRLTIAVATSAAILAIGLAWAHLAILALILPVLATLIGMMPQGKTYWSGGILTLASVVYCLLIH